jgi:hypothetical protein
MEREGSVPCPQEHSSMPQSTKSTEAKFYEGCLELDVLKF